MDARPDRPRARHRGETGLPSARSARRYCFLLLAAFAAASPSGPALAQEPAILAPDPRPIGARAAELSYGAELSAKEGDLPSPEPVAGAAGALRRLTRLLPMSLRIGVSDNVDIIASWRGRLQAVDAGGRRFGDWGDPSLFAKVTLTDSGAAIAAGFLFGFKIPSSRNLPARMGSDAMDGFLLAAAGYLREPFEIRATAGLGILGDPRFTGSQNDVLTGGLHAAFRMSGWTSLFSGVDGFTGPRDGDDKLQLRGGASARTPAGTVTVYGFGRIAGGARDYSTAFLASASWGVGASVSHRLGL